MEKIQLHKIQFWFTSTAESHKSQSKSPWPNLVALFNHALPLRASQNRMLPNSGGTHGGIPISIPGTVILI